MALQPDLSVAYMRHQAKISALTASTVHGFFGQMTDEFDASWAKVQPRVLATIQAGRASALAASANYVQSTLDEDGIDAPPSGDMNPAGFLNSAPDGRTMEGLLEQAPILAKTEVARGSSAVDALGVTGRWLSLITLTVIADTRREFIQADIGQRPKVTGFIRVLNPPSCYRCAILAGRWYRYDADFRRHPRCDCSQRAATEESARGKTVDPYAYFHSLSAEDQVKAFGKSEARSIHEGADIFRVLNAKNRGLSSAGSRQAIKYGTPTRKTVDEIFRTAGTRTNAIRMLKDEGYITGPQNPAGNILGQREGFGQLGKGGKARAATNAVLEARRTGVRDPLNRYTMTAAERRLYDAKTRLDAAETQGIYLRSIGANSADKHNPAQRITAGQLATVRKAYANEVERVRRLGSPTAKAFANALGVRF